MLNARIAGRVPGRTKVRRSAKSVWLGRSVLVSGTRNVRLVRKGRSVRQVRRIAQAAAQARKPTITSRGVRTAQMGHTVRETPMESVFRVLMDISAAQRQRAVSLAAPAVRRMKITVRARSVSQEHRVEVRRTKLARSADQARCRTRIKLHASTAPAVRTVTGLGMWSACRVRLGLSVRKDQELARDAVRARKRMRTRRDVTIVRRGRSVLGRRTICVWNARQGATTQRQDRLCVSCALWERTTQRRGVVGLLTVSHVHRARTIQTRAKHQPRIVWRALRQCSARKGLKRASRASMKQ